eukprot:2963751-Pleurochrysis_carterae.AAC.1
MAEAARAQPWPRTPAAAGLCGTWRRVARKAVERTGASDEGLCACSGAGSSATTGVATATGIGSDLEGASGRGVKTGFSVGRSAARALAI